MWAQKFRAFVHVLAKHRQGVVKFAAHAGILRALTGKRECDG